LQPRGALKPVQDLNVNATVARNLENYED